MSSIPMSIFRLKRPKLQFFLIPLGFLFVLLPIVLAYYYQTRPRPHYLSPLTSPSTMEKKLALQKAVKRDTKGTDLASHIALSQTYLEEAVSLSQNTNQNEADKRNILHSLNLAITTASQTTNRFADQPEAWSQLGQVYQAATSVDKAYWNKAQAAYQKALSLDPANVKLLSLLGNSYIQNNQFGQAETQFAKVAKLDPYNTANLYWLSVSLEKQGRLNESVKYLNQLLATESPSSPLHHTAATQIKRLNALLAQAPTELASTANTPTPPPPASPTTGFGSLLPSVSPVPSPTPLPIQAELDLIPEERAMSDSGYTIASPSKTQPATESLSGTATSNALTGQLTLPAGQTELKQNNTLLTPQSKIYLTVDTPGNYTAYVKSINYSEGWFIIKTDHPAPKDLTISYWITE